MDDVTDKKARWWERWLGKTSTVPYAYIEPRLIGDLPAISADDSAPVRIPPTFTEIPEAAPDPRAYAAQISTALHRLFEQPQEDSEATKAADDPAFRTLSSLFPVAYDTTKPGMFVLRNEQAAMVIEPSRISLYAMTGDDGQRDIKKAFTADRAYAMVLVASKSKKMLENGIRLSGSQEQQEILRVAIERVNNELPIGQKLTILPPIATVQPAQAVVEENSAEGQAVSAPAPAPVAPAAKSFAAPVVAAQPKPAAPAAKPAPVPVADAVDPERRGFFTLGGGKAKKTAATQEPGKAANADKLISRRTLVAGGIGALVAASVPSLLDKGKTLPEGAVSEAEKSGVNGSAAAPAGQREARLAPQSTAPTHKYIETPPPTPAPPSVAEPRAPKRDFARNSAPERGAVAENDFAPKTQSPEPADQKKPLSGQIRITRQATHERVVINLSHTNPLECKPSEFRRCLEDFNYVARDRRANKMTEMDPALLKVVAEVTTRLRARGYAAKELTLNSGYRSPETNRKAGGAKDSLHMEGKAIDFSIEGVPTRVLCDVCREVVGKKGWVKHSHKGFAHLDTRGYDMHLG